MRVEDIMNGKNSGAEAPETGASLPVLLPAPVSVSVVGNSPTEPSRRKSRKTYLSPGTESAGIEEDSEGVVPPKQARRSGYRFDHLKKTTMVLGNGVQLKSRVAPKAPAEKKPVDINRISHVKAMGSWDKQAHSLATQMVTRVIDFDNPGFLTLRIKDSELCQNDKVWKRFISDLQKRFKSAWGMDLDSFWIVEADKRGRPHGHMFLNLPTGKSAHPTKAGSSNRAQYEHLNDLDWTNWLESSWAEITGQEEDDKGDLNEYASTSIREDNSLAAVISYFVKTGDDLAAKAATSKRLPNLWPEEGRTQMYGRTGLSEKHPELELDHADFRDIKRICQNLFTEYEHADLETGELSKRRVNVFGNHGLIGGVSWAGMSPAIREKLLRRVEERKAEREAGPIPEGAIFRESLADRLAKFKANKPEKAPVVTAPPVPRAIHNKFSRKTLESALEKAAPAPLPASQVNRVLPEVLTLTEAQRAAQARLAELYAFRTTDRRQRQLNDREIRRLEAVLYP